MAVEVGEFDGPGLAPHDIDGAAPTPPFDRLPDDPRTQVAVEQRREVLLGGDGLLDEEEVGPELVQDSRPVGPSRAARAEVVGRQDHRLPRPVRLVLGIG